MISIFAVNEALCVLRQRRVSSQIYGTLGSCELGLVGIVPTVQTSFINTFASNA